MKFKKGQVPWNKGKRHTSKSILKMSKSHKGQLAWNKGIPMSQASKDKESRNKKGMPAKFINISKEDKFKKILSQKKISKPEVFLLELIQENSFPFEYVGNGAYFIIGKEDVNGNGNHELFNPDFICREQRKIIEVYSRWHITIKSNIKRDEKRELAYKNKGFGLLILFDYELIKENRQYIINKIKEFLCCQD